MRRRKVVKSYEDFDEHKQVFIFVGSFDKFFINSIILIFLQGDYIWIEPVSKREFDVAIGARVVSAEGRKIQVCYKTCQKCLIRISASILSVTLRLHVWDAMVYYT